MERARFWSGHIKLSARQLPPSAFFDALALIQGDTMGLPPANVSAEPFNIGCAGQTKGRFRRHALPFRLSWAMTSSLST